MLCKQAAGFVRAFTPVFAGVDGFPVFLNTPPAGTAAQLIMGFPCADFRTCLKFSSRFMRVLGKLGLQPQVSGLPGFNARGFGT